MQIRYPEYRADAERSIKIKLFLPDRGEITGYVLALHGFAGSMESWAITALAERLTLQKTAVIAFNYAGHGSDRQDALFGLQRCLADYRHMISYARAQFPEALWRGVFATSFGGYLTLCSLQQIPDFVQIVLRAPAINMQDVFARIVEQEGGGMAAYAENGCVVLGNARKLRVPYSFYQALCAQDVFQQDHDREMLLIHGDCDQIVLPADTAAFCARNPKIVRNMIQGADHLFLHPGELGQVMDTAVPWLLPSPEKIF